MSKDQEQAALMRGELKEQRAGSPSTNGDGRTGARPTPGELLACPYADFLQVAYRASQERL